MGWSAYVWFVSVSAGMGLVVLFEDVDSSLVDLLPGTISNALRGMPSKCGVVVFAVEPSHVVIKPCAGLIQGLEVARIVRAMFHRSKL